MKKADFNLEFIKDNRTLGRLVETLENKPAFALDIETTEWWNRQREKISLVQFAYRHGPQVKVAVIDAFAAPVTELPTRYSPDALAVSVGGERVGMASWIIDRRLGAEADLDEETIKSAIADLCERQLVRINEMRRLIATDEGMSRWQKVRND